MKTKPTFEDNLKRLEEIVKKLESGEESLDNSLLLYEEGAKLAASCYKRLDQAQQKVIEFSKPMNQNEEKEDE